MNTGPIDLRLQRLRERLGWVPFFVLITALAATALASWYVAVTGREKDEARFVNEARNTVEEIENRITTYESLLRGAGGLFAAEPGVTKGEFGRYVDRLDLPRLYPGIQGLGYSVRIPRQKVPELEEQMSSFYPDFHVWPPVEDPFVHAIQYLEPLDRRNREAIGYNMFSEKTRRLAMERARDTGAAAASGIVHLVQEIDEDVQAGFLIYLPLYDSDEIPRDLVSRRASLEGFVYAPFRADDLLDDIFGEARPAVAFRIYDGPSVSEAKILHTSPLWLDAESDRRLERLLRIRVAQRVWTVHVVSLPGFTRQDSQINAGWIAVIGVLLSIALFLLTRGQTRARVKAEKAAADLRRSEKVLRQTEARVRSLVESNIIGIVLGGTGGEITEANEAFLSMIGRSGDDAREEALTLGELSTTASAELLDYVFVELRRNGRFGPYEHSFQGGRREVPALVGMVLVESDPMSWVAFVLDLTDRKHMEEQLLEQKETLETLNRVQQVVSAELQVENVLAAVTGAAASLTSADEAAFFHRDPAAESDYTFVSPRSEDRSSTRRIRRDHPIVTEALTDGAPDGTDRRDPEGDDLLAVPVISRFGTIVGALVVSRAGSGGFSERDRQVAGALSAQAAIAVDNATLYQDARHDRNRAEQANRAKDQFLANLSHELRTPMTAIIGWIRMLQLGGLDDEEYHEAIAAIARSAQAQAQLIEDILDVSRIATGKMKVDRKLLDLRGVIDAAVDSVWPSVETKSIELTSNVPDEPIMVVGDEQRLQQVIWNLLSNAVKFTPEKGRIDIDATVREGQAVLSIRDDGEGIEPEALPFIFERFRQADGTTTRTFGGLGLGLSLVDYIVRAHGGVAMAESEGRGKGARFQVEIPVADEGETPRQSPDSAPEAVSLEGIMVLVAEDDTEIRELVHSILRHAGAEVVSVKDAARALDHLLNGEFDVLVSDIAMPGETGITLIREIRSWQRESRTIPAIALTAYAAEEDRRKILEAGYDDCLMKPLEPGELVQAIVTLIRAETQEPDEVGRS